MIRRQPPVFSPLPLGALLRYAVPAPERAAETLRATVRKRFPVEDALLCGSGTQALQLALQAACRPGRGGRLVALPAFACYDLASAAIGANVEVVFYDIDPDTLAADMASLSRALEREPAAVVVAPLFGYQPDWDAVRALTTRHGARLIEDAAQSFGALWRGEPVGGIGDLSVLSFGRGKGWTAVEGGALLGPEAEIERLRTALPPCPAGAAATARTLLEGLAQWAFARPLLYGLPTALPALGLGETVYRPPVAPRALGPRSARLALETLGVSEREADARRARTRAMARRVEALGSADLRVPRVQDGSEPGGLRLPVVASPEVRGRLLERGRALGIMPGYPLPLPELPPLEPHIVEARCFPGAEALAERLVTLPTHSLLRDSDMSLIAVLLRDADG